MTIQVAPVNVEWSATPEPDSQLYRFACIDSRTDRRYEFLIPGHTLPALRTFIDELLTRNPDTLGHITTRRLD